MSRRSYKHSGESVVIAFSEPPVHLQFRRAKSGSSWFSGPHKREAAISLAQALVARGIHGVIRRANPKLAKRKEYVDRRQVGGYVGPAPSAIIIIPPASRAGGRPSYDQVYSAPQRGKQTLEAGIQDQTGPSRPLSIMAAAQNG